MLKRGLVVLVASATTLAFVACGGGQESATSTEAAVATTEAPAEGTPVTITVGETSPDEMYMEADPASVEAGPVTFIVANEGAKEHELVVIRTDTPAADLQVGADDKVDEEAYGEVIGEVEDVAAGESKSATMDLEPGHYALICNITGHYRMGMFTDFEVR